MASIPPSSTTISRPVLARLLRERGASSALTDRIDNGDEERLSADDFEAILKNPPLDLETMPGDCRRSRNILALLRGPDLYTTAPEKNVPFPPLQNNASSALTVKSSVNRRWNKVGAFSSIAGTRSGAPVFNTRPTPLLGLPRSGAYCPSRRRSGSRSGSRCAAATGRAGDPPRLIAASEKARTELGWQPQYQEIEKIVASAWAWHVANPEGYGD